MSAQYLAIGRMLLDQRVTRVPKEILSELTRRGRRQMPEDVSRSLGGVMPGLKVLRFMHRWLSTERITRHAGQWVINSFLPPFPGVAYERMFTNLLSGRRLSPVSTFLALTSECPYRCWHCSYKKNGATGRSRRMIGSG